MNFNKKVYHKLGLIKSSKIMHYSRFCLEHCECSRELMILQTLLLSSSSMIHVLHQCPFSGLFCGKLWFFPLSLSPPIFTDSDLNRFFFTAISQFFFLCKLGMLYVCTLQLHNNSDTRVFLWKNVG